MTHFIADQSWPSKRVFVIYNFTPLTVISSAFWLIAGSRHTLISPPTWSVGGFTMWRLGGGESSLRFSLWTGHPSIDKHGQSQFIEIIVSLPVDYLDVSAGFYNVDKRLIYPTLPDVLSSRRTGTLDLARRYPHIQFIMSGKSSGAWDPSLPANVHVGICRDLIANPNFLRDRDQGCNDCMKCHYFSRGQSYLTCGRWTYPRVLPFPVKQA